MLCWLVLQFEQGTQNARTVAHFWGKPADAEAHSDSTTEVRPQSVGARMASKPAADGPDVCISARVVEKPRSGRPTRKIL